MSSTFTGFSEEDLQRIKSNQTGVNSGPQISTSNIKKIDKIGAKPKKATNQYKLPLPTLNKEDLDESIEDLFEKCKLSIKTPTSPHTHEFEVENNNTINKDNPTGDNLDEAASIEIDVKNNTDIEDKQDANENENRKNSIDVAPDIVRCVDNYTEDDIAAHKAKLEELQLKQKIMEEQNKKRKEMLAKALADRTKQTAEEVMKLEKIKKELQVLDGQLSQDVAVLRKKIDQACLSYAEAEKHYLKIEKEFLQAKIHLQKEKEKKELLTDHLSALIIHNETRKAHKLETLMLELATDKKTENNIAANGVDDDEQRIIVDGVDEKTGKMVELTET